MLTLNQKIVAFGTILFLDVVFFIFGGLLGLLVGIGMTLTLGWTLLRQ